MDSCMYRRLVLFKTETGVGQKRGTEREMKERVRGKKGERVGKTDRQRVLYGRSKDIRTFLNNSIDVKTLDKC